MLFPAKVGRVISSSTGRRRELHTEGETGWCQALQKRGQDRQQDTESPCSWARSPGDRAHGHSRTWPGPWAIQGPCTTLLLTSRPGKEKERRKKLGNGPSLPFPVTHTVTVSGTHWAGEVTLGAQSECSGEETLPFPFSNTPSTQGHVQGVPAAGSWGTGKCVE